MKISERYLQFLFCFLFMTCIAIEVFSYTFFGNRIATATNSLTTSTYFSIWYERPLPYRKYLIIFMERMKRNSVLLAGKLFPVNLALFTTVRIRRNGNENCVRGMIFSRPSILVAISQSICLIHQFACRLRALSLL